MKGGTGQGTRGTEKADPPQYRRRALAVGTELAPNCASRVPCLLPRAPLLFCASTQP